MQHRRAREQSGSPGLREALPRDDACRERSKVCKGWAHQVGDGIARLGTSRSLTEGSPCCSWDACASRLSATFDCAAAACSRLRSSIAAMEASMIPAQGPLASQNTWHSCILLHGVQAKSLPAQASCPAHNSCTSCMAHSFGSLHSRDRGAACSQLSNCVMGSVAGSSNLKQRTRGRVKKR